MSDHLDINREGWNKRTLIHLESDFYDQAAFVEGKNSLKEIELGIIGDVKGKRIAHLQCHFGQDSISLAKMGAQVTAVDLSPLAIDKANELAHQMGQDVKFICSDVLADGLLAGETFDMVFVTYGAIPWLEDLKPWAELVQRLLTPGGQLVLVEFHPVVHMFDDDMQEMEYAYFRQAAITGEQNGTYADTAEDEIAYVVWNHSLSETMGALIETGLSIKHFGEYPYSPWPCFPGMTEISPGRHVIERFGDKLPLCFSIVAEK